MTEPPPEVDVAALANAICTGDRGALARAITLVESTRADDRISARRLLSHIAPHIGKSHRVGITGVPGVGKSSLIEALGIRLTAAGRHVAVLAVDPSSTRSGGSILGDKTRMQELSRDPRAFIRPSPSGGTLGGVARNTREAISLCEAAGFDVVLVETVGVGQSEVQVANMVDFFLLLALARAGDELQGIKRGVLELADWIVVTKADGENVDAAERARQEYTLALHLLRPRSPNWVPKASTCSVVTGTGIDHLWSAIEDHRARLEHSGEWKTQREAQARGALWESVERGLLDALQADPRVRTRLAELQCAVDSGTMSPDEAADLVLTTFLARPQSGS